ncbi:MAG: sugar ABC transporter ATP-binding protein [Clostridiales bacterium]|nr:sugar ABC transporter ATP-binding protein [Clostridiales bacterium]
MAERILDLRGICKAFSGNRVLSNVDFSIDAGEVVCLCGENGSGKSTLIKIISGVYTLDAGTVAINGRNYQKLTAAQSITEGIQVIYQDFSVFSNLTVSENIAMSYRVHNRKRFVSARFNDDLAREALRQVGVELQLNREVEQLSVAEKQIVAICRAICQDAKLIIMDEPTTAITQREIEKLFEIIRNLKKKGVAVMFVSHKLDEVMAICDRVTVLRSGEKVVDQSAEGFPHEKLAYYMTGKEIQEEPFAFADCGRNPLLSAESLSRAGAFEDVSFRVCPGEILAVTGQLGSGRTELAKALFGLLPATSGRIFIDGRETPIRSRRDALKNNIAYLPEDRLSEGLLLNRSLGDNFSSAVIDRMKNKFGIVPEKSVRALSVRWMEALRMSVKPYTTVASEYSGGNQQRIVLGKWLAADPKIFILNCPTVGVDVKSKSEIHAIIKDLARRGMAIVLISDDVGEIMTTSNRVMIMSAGRVVFESDTQSVSASDISQRIVGAY